MKRDYLLDWYFVEAPYLLGAPAMSMEPTSRSVGQAPQGLPEYVVENATSYRAIGEAVERLAHEHQSALRRYYTPLSPALRRIYHDLGDLAGVLLSMHNAGDLASLVIQARKDKHARVLLGEHKDAARTIVDAAHKAYREACRDRDRAEAARRRAKYEAMFKGAA